MRAWREGTTHVRPVTETNWSMLEDMLALSGADLLLEDTLDW